MTRVKIKAGRHIAAAIAADRGLRRANEGGLEMTDRMLRRVLRLLQDRQSRTRNAEERRVLRYAITHWRAIIGKHDVGGDLRGDIDACQLLIPIVSGFASVARRRHAIVHELDACGIWPRREIHLAARVCRDYAVASGAVVKALRRIAAECQQELDARMAQ